MEIDQMYKAHWKPPPTTNYWPFYPPDKLSIAGQDQSLQVCAKEHIYVVCLRMSEKVWKGQKSPEKASAGLELV